MVKLPTSWQEWKSVVENACDENNHRWQKKDAVQLFQKFGLQDRACPVHCECGVIQYLQTKHCDSWDNVSVFGYIGVSKLSCSACRVWIEAFNELGGPKFYTRGSHGKWYWPWGMPMAEGPLKEKMREKVLDEYIMQLEQKGKIKKRASSDSSGAIPSGAEHNISTTRLQSAQARADAAVQESGGDMELFFDASVADVVG